MKTRSSGLALLVLAATAGAVHADFIATAVLAGANERPTPTNSLGTGLATITYEAAKNDLLYNVTYSGLSGNATVSHIQVGPITGTGPVVLPFTPSPTGMSGTLSGVLHDSDIINSASTGLTTIAQIADQILAGNTYVNINSDLFPGGEIRGQLGVSSVPEPSSLTLLVLGGAGVVVGAWSRRRKSGA